jgi:hypothetical protein
LFPPLPALVPPLLAPPAALVPPLRAPPAALVPPLPLAPPDPPPVPPVPLEFMGGGLLAGYETQPGSGVAGDAGGAV